MRIYIAHRGNINGRIEERENQPDYILEALDGGYDVEIDVWYMSGRIFLGHDRPQYVIDKTFLDDPRLWVHCKNILIMEQLCGDLSINMFAHENDTVITTGGYLWTAPGGILTPKSIAVMPELAKGWDISTAMGVCTDYPMFYKYSQ